MTARDLYKTLSQTYGLPSLMLCDLHKPCNSPAKRRCNEVLSHPLINFDNVKSAFQKGKPGPQKASSDGYTFQSEWFCFVEIKGWRDYLWYNPDSTKEEITVKASEYNLLKKFQDSVYVCQQITQNANLFKDKKIAFFLVTDIETSQSGISLFANNLNLLATKIPSKEDFCNQSLCNQLKSIPQDVSTFYVECSHFDKAINGLP